MDRFRSVQLGTRWRQGPTPSVSSAILRAAVPVRPNPAPMMERVKGTTHFLSWGAFTPSEAGQVGRAPTRCRRQAAGFDAPYAPLVKSLNRNLVKVAERHTTKAASVPASIPTAIDAPDGSSASAATANPDKPPTTSHVAPEARTAAPIRACSGSCAGSDAGSRPLTPARPRTSSPGRRTPLIAGICHRRRRRRIRAATPSDGR